MSTQNGDAVVKPTPPKPTTSSGIRTVLRYTGIPVSLLDKKPKLPSRNWLIFLSVTSSLVGYYVYDRRECRKIQQEYVDKVKALAEDPIDPLDVPRKITVYGAKWPGDEDYQQAMKYFRKYVKPILVAAAVDFDMISGKRQGDIARRVAEDTRQRRRLDLGIDDASEAHKLLPTYKPLSEVRRRELEGGIIIVGRPTFKEFMAGLKRGWTQGLNKVDADEQLSQILDNDHHFDEINDEEPATPALSTHSPVFSMPTYQVPKQEPVATGNNEIPSTIPQLPPVLLVPFHNRIGFTQIPLMIWDWFHRRYWVQSGAEAGFRIVMNQTRPINVPQRRVEGDDSPVLTSDSSNNGDLDFDKEADQLLKRSLEKIPEETEKEREAYYSKLPAKLETARALARGTREPTKDELANPPPTEVELRAERLKKERRWRNDVESWNLVKPSAPVEWDERLHESLRVFCDPSEGQ